MEEWCGWLVGCICGGGGCEVDEVGGIGEGLDELF